LKVIIASLPVWRIMLVTEEDVEPFYEKLGFKEIQIVMAHFAWERLYDVN
jgi:hypothetical protein